MPGPDVGLCPDRAAVTAVALQHSRTDRGRLAVRGGDALHATLLRWIADARHLRKVRAPVAVLRLDWPQRRHRPVEKGRSAAAPLSRGPVPLPDRPERARRAPCE